MPRFYSPPPHLCQRCLFRSCFVHFLCSYLHNVAGRWLVDELPLQGFSLFNRSRRIKWEKEILSLCGTLRTFGSRRETMGQLRRSTKPIDAVFDAPEWENSQAGDYCLIIEVRKIDGKNTNTCFGGDSCISSCLLRTPHCLTFWYFVFRYLRSDGRTHADNDSFSFFWFYSDRDCQDHDNLLVDRWKSHQSCVLFLRQVWAEIFSETRWSKSQFLVTLLPLWALVSCRA